MIATLRGEISQIEENALILEVGGVGLRVLVPAPLRAKAKAGEKVFMYHPSPGPGRCVDALRI